MNGGPASGGASPGARLRAVREERGITLLRAAEQLRLDPAILAALEADDYERLGAPVFVRGHLRKYSRLLGVPGEPLVELYDDRHGGRGSPTLIPQATAQEYSPDRQSMSAPVIATALLSLLALGMWWWTRSQQPPAPITDSVVTPPEPAQAGATDASATEAAVTATPPAEESPAPTPAVGALSLTVTEPTWIEVQDATGQRLARELLTPPGERVFTGTGPWRLLIGNVAATRIVVAGTPVTVPAELTGGNTAWLEVAADGTAGEPGAPRPAAVNPGSEAT